MDIGKIQSNAKVVFNTRNIELECYGSPTGDVGKLVCIDKKKSKFAHLLNDSVRYFDLITNENSLKLVAEHTEKVPERLEVL